MQTYISTRDELNETVQAAVERAVTQKLPEIIRRITAKEYLTIAETCEVLDCTRRHLMYLRSTRTIPYVKHGKKIYFRTKDLEEYFERNLIPAGTR